MDEYKILGTLHNIIDNDTEEKIQKWLESHNVNYYLLYPLAAIEFGLQNEPPESTSNLFRRCIATYIYSKAKEYGKEIYLRKFNVEGFKKFLKSYKNDVMPLYQNYRFSREINDLNPITKPRLVKQSEKKYKLVTSLVSDVYQEEMIYFYGLDDLEKADQENKVISETLAKFWYKILYGDKRIKELQDNIDLELYEICIKVVEKDLNKWNSRVKSKVFDGPKQLAKVIGYFYYQAVLKKICIDIDIQNGKDSIECGMKYIMVFERKLCIKNISKISNISQNKVETIIKYFINDGKMNLFEFPLFEVEDKILTIPSVIMINDWQFSIINGHYIKQIPIKNREKTISAVTENRIESVLKDVKNVALVKTKPYSFVDETGKNQCSDIDYAIYDITRNVLLIIEAKWIDKHYKDEIDKRYGKIFETLNNIFEKQIKKHRIYLQSKDNIGSLFDGNDRYCKDYEKPQIFYLAVDKRNQMHINDRHMISEYMMIYYLRKYIQNEELNLVDMWKEINSLETKVEYIEGEKDYYEIPIGEVNILIEKSELEEPLDTIS